MIRKRAIRISFFTWVLIGLTTLSMFCLLLAYASFYISPAKVWWLAFFGLAYPMILAVNLFFVFLWLFMRKKYLWIPLIPILAGFSHITSLVQLRSNSVPPASGSLKVLTYNMHGHGEYYREPSKNGNLNKVIEFLSGQDADIICLQEFFIKTTDTVTVLGEIGRNLDTRHYFFKNYFKGRSKKYVDALIIFSRYPIIRTGYDLNSRKFTSAIFADISIEGEIFRVYNMHLESFHFVQEDYAFYSNLTEDEPVKTQIKEGSLKIFKKLKKAYELRAKQVDDLRLRINSSPYPVLICGDLNDTPSSYTLQVLGRGRYDSFKKAGSGFFGNTFRGNLPSFRIDYILFDKRFEAYNYERMDILLSDHYPISAYINIHPAK